MIIKKPMMFFGPEGVAVSHMGMPEMPPDPVTPDDPNDSLEEEDVVAPDLEPGEGTPGEGDPDTEPVVAAPGTFQMDAATLAAALKAAGIGGAVAPVVAQPQVPLTPEQRTAMLKELKRRNFNDPEFLKKLNNMETQGSALEEYQDGIIEHVTQIMAAYMNQERQGLVSQFNPALKFVSDYQTKEQFSRFNVAYKELANPALEPLRNLAIQQLNATGTKFNSEAEVFAGVAKAMEKLIQAGSPTFKLSSGSIPASKPTNAITPRPSRGGGGGGAASSATQPSGVPKAVSFMPKIK